MVVHGYGGDGGGMLGDGDGGSGYDGDRGVLL